MWVSVSLLLSRETTSGSTSSATTGKYKINKLFAIANHA